MTHLPSRPQSFVLSGNPALLFVVTTAMATTVATAISTVLSNARDREEVTCACACEQEPAPAPAAGPATSAQPERIEATFVERGGTLDRELIRGVVRDRIADIRECYNHGLQADPELGGRIVVAFTIDESGASQAVRAEPTTTFPSRVVVDCVVAAVDGWTFPAPEGGEVDVVYPFVLEPG